MPFKVLIRSLSVLIFFSAQAQAQMFPSDEAYIVNFSGDTIKGDIIINNSSEIKFKPNGNKQYIILNPNEINVVLKGKDLFYRSVTGLQSVLSVIF